MRGGGGMKKIKRIVTFMIHPTIIQPDTDQIPFLVPLIKGHVVPLFITDNLILP